MPTRNDPLRIATSVAVYAVLCYAAQIVFYLVLGMAGMLAGVTLTVLLSAIFANWLVLRIYQHCSLPALGRRLLSRHCSSDRAGKASVRTLRGYRAE